MPYLLIPQRIEDGVDWEPVFGERDAAPEANGFRGGHLLRNADDPDELVILLEWDDLQQARRFAQSDDLRKTMERVGVTDRPDVYFLEEVEQLSG